MRSQDHGGCHRTSNLTALSHRFTVRTEDSRVGRQVEALLEGLREEGAPVAGPADCSYVLRTSTDGRIDVLRDGTYTVRAQRPGDAIGWLVWDLTRGAAEAGRDHLLLHAAGLQHSDIGVVIPGPSGSGKSTLAAGLVRAGLAYLSDELIALELERGYLLPYAKPISVKPGSFGVLGDMFSSTVSAANEQWSAGEMLLAVGDSVCRPVGVACMPELVVVPRYEPGCRTTLARLSETEAFAALAVNAVNFVHHGADGAQALGELVARCRCVALTMSDLDQAVDLILGLLPDSRADTG